jgi:hypothetical protein
LKKVLQYSCHDRSLFPADSGDVLLYREPFSYDKFIGSDLREKSRYCFLTFVYLTQLLDRSRCLVRRSFLYNGSFLFLQRNFLSLSTRKLLSKSITRERTYSSRVRSIVIRVEEGSRTVLIQRTRRNKKKKMITESCFPCNENLMRLPDIETYCSLSQEQRFQVGLRPTRNI